MCVRGDPGQIHLFRLRPGTTYDAVLCAMLKPTDDGTAAADDDYNVNANSSTVVGCSANVTFVSAKTGYEFLDNAPIAEVRRFTSQPLFSAAHADRAVVSAVRADLRQPWVRGACV